MARMGRSGTGPGRLDSAVVKLHSGPANVGLVGLLCLKEVP